jgi:hypothetical protein
MRAHSQFFDPVMIHAVLVLVQYSATMKVLES